MRRWPRTNRSSVRQQLPGKPRFLSAGRTNSSLPRRCRRLLSHLSTLSARPHCSTPRRRRSTPQHSNSLAAPSIIRRRVRRRTIPPPRTRLPRPRTIRCSQIRPISSRILLLLLRLHPRSGEEDCPCHLRGERPPLVSSPFLYIFIRAPTNLDRRDDRRRPGQDRLCRDDGSPARRTL